MERVELVSNPAESLTFGKSTASTVDDHTGNRINQYVQPSNDVGIITGEHPYREHAS